MLNILLSNLIDSEKQMSLTKIYANSYERSVFMTLNSFIKGALSAAAITMAGSFAYAQQAGGSLVFLVQPEPPTMAGYVSTSGPIGLLGPKIYDGLVNKKTFEIHFPKSLTIVLKILSFLPSKIYFGLVGKLTKYQKKD